MVASGSENPVFSKKTGFCSSVIPDMPRLFSRNQKPQQDKSAGQKKRPASFGWLTLRSIRRLQVGLAIGLCAGSIVAVILLVGGLNRYDLRFADLLYRPRPPSGKVVLVAMDDKTIAEYGWPIERVPLGGGLFAIMRAKPSVIVLGFVLPDLTAKLEDEYLAAIIQRAGKIVQPVLGIEATRYPPYPGMFPAYDSLLSPAETLRTTNTTLAHAGIYPDPDGVVRRIPLAIDAPGRRYPAVGLAALVLYQDREPGVGIQNNQAIFGDTHVPVDESGQLLIHFVQRAALPTVSYVDIAQGRADLSILRDKIVLVGPISKDIPEDYAVPLAIGVSRAFNVELQADLLETLLGGKFLREQDRLAHIGEVLLLAVIAGATLSHLSWLYAAALTLLYFAVYLLYAFQRFDDGIVVTPLYAALVLLLTYIGTMLYRYFSEERTRAFISRIFLRMVPPEAVAQVLTLYDRGALSLSGGRREVTVLCASLRGISSLSEASAPEAIIELLNQSMASITRVVFRHGGSVTNQVGNVIVALWNFPLTQPDHAQRAVRAAFEIQREVLNLRATPAGGSEVGVAMGVATGTVVTGYLSASARADYSVVGDVVNLAERISVLAAADQVLVDPATHERVHADLETRQIHTLRLRGKKDPIVVWEVRETTKASELLATDA